MEIVDLYRTESPSEARRLYSIMIVRLMVRKAPPMQIVEACRQVRRWAKRAGEIVGDVWSFEIDALVGAGQFEQAWELHEEKVAYGKRLLQLDEYEAAAEWCRAGLSYFCGRFDEARDHMEAHLAGLLDNGVKSFEFLSNVINDDSLPEIWQRVTLTHIDEAAGVPMLTHWGDWDRYVDGLHTRLFEVAVIEREALRATPALLRGLSNCWRAIGDQRRTSGISFGEDDIVEDEGTVRQRHNKTSKEREKYNREIEPRMAQTDRVLDGYFPFLNESE